MHEQVQTRPPERHSRPSTIKESVGDRLFLAGIYLFLLLVLVIILFPLLYIVSASLSSPGAVASGRVLLWPVDFSLRNYSQALGDQRIPLGLFNSLFYTFFGTVISVALTIAIAYPLSRRTFYGRGVLMAAIVFTMLFSGGLIPTYLVVKSVGLLNTRWALLIPQAIGVWQVIVARTFFQSNIPDDLEEAAALDGCGDLRFIWSVVLPLSRPIMAILILMYATFQWNSYFDALIYLRDPDLFPLQLILRSSLVQNTANSSSMALIVLSTIPALIIYRYVHRFFTQGMLLGAVRG
ncbi:MAG: sugar ABC transporter permease [Chloroflexi bacterium 54-19]|nr:MAG: sugar ABC transporter permease [Chloroflexi bacterium 54-19]